MVWVISLGSLRRLILGSRDMSLMPEESKSNNSSINEEAASYDLYCFFLLGQ